MFTAGLPSDMLSNSLVQVVAEAMFPACSMAALPVGALAIRPRVAPAFGQLVPVVMAIGLPT